MGIDGGTAPGAAGRKWPANRGRSRADPTNLPRPLGPTRKQPCASARLTLQAAHRRRYVAQVDAVVVTVCERPVAAPCDGARPGPMRDPAHARGRDTRSSDGCPPTAQPGDPFSNWVTRDAARHTHRPRAAESASAKDSHTGRPGLVRRPTSRPATRSCTGALGPRCPATADRSPGRGRIRCPTAKDPTRRPHPHSRIHSRRGEINE